MASARNIVIDLMVHGALPAERLGEALEVAGVAPDGKDWRRFVDQLLLWVGGMALAFAAMFFVAYNWDDIGRFAKFGLAEALLAASVGAYWKFAEHRVAGKVSLLAATVLLGVLLALVGQTYQTGADAWQLFLTWAVLMLPWAIIGRFDAIWLVWIGLINLSAVLYFQAIPSPLFVLLGAETGAQWVVFAINTAAVLVWELLGIRRHRPAPRWAVRLLAVGSGMPVTWLAVVSLFEHSAAPGAWAVWAVWLAALYATYRRLRPDLFMLAGGCLSAIVVTVTLVALHLPGGAENFLLLSLLVVGLGSGAAVWLRNLHREWQA